MTDERVPAIKEWRGCPFVPYLNLTPSQKEEARRQFSPKGRRMGYEQIQNWAWAVRSDGRLSKCPYIEPLYPPYTIGGSMTYEFQGFRIPPHMLDSLQHYINEGRPVGDFLEAVLSNDLYRACNHADSVNLRNIPAYVAYLYNEAPGACWGSKERVRDWYHDKWAERQEAL